MRSINNLAADLAAAMQQEPGLLDLQLTPWQTRVVAGWVLQTYRPVVQWEEVPPNEKADEPHDRFAWQIRCRVTVAGKVIEYVAHETAEMRRRAPQNVKDRFREHIRYHVGRALMDHLDEPSS